MMRFASFIFLVLAMTTWLLQSRPGTRSQAQLPESGSFAVDQSQPFPDGYIQRGFECDTESDQVIRDASEGFTEIVSVSQRKPTPAGVVILNPENGHYYKYVELRDVTWSRAFRMAATLSYNQLPGYLVTITSEQENEFLLHHWGERSHVWLGASDQEVEGEWRWMCGPEAGSVFWLGTTNGEAAGFSAWKSNEPNNSFPSSTDPSDEDFACLNYERAGWNDLPNDPVKGVFRPHGFIVEYSALNIQQLEGTHR